MKRYWPVLMFSLLAAVVYADTAPVSLQSILKAAPKANPIGSDTHLTAMKGSTLVYVNATSIKPPLATTATAGIVRVGTGLAMDAEGKLNNTGIAGVASFKGRGGAVLPATGDYTAAMITGLSTVGISGSYTDLINQPTIPAAQVPSDWTASSGVARILNKPTVPTALSQLTQDSTHRTVTDAEKATWNTSSASVNSVNGQTGTVTLAATDVGADPLGSATSVQTNLNAHTGATNNPHSVTKAQVGLGNADNTSDANKPVSTATQAALDLKANASSLGTAAAKDVPVSGNASATQVVMGSDTRLGAQVTVAVIPDGTTDNSAEINATATTAGTGGTLLFPKRAQPYVTAAELVPLAGQRWIFEKGATVKKKTGSATVAVINASAGNVVISGATIQGDYPSSSNRSDGIVFNNATGGLVENVTVTNFRYDTTNDSRGIYILNSTRVQVNNVKVSQSNNNILLQNSSYCQISNAILEDNYLSEALSIYGDSNGWSDHNTVVNIAIVNANTGINIQKGRFNTIGGAITINNARKPIAVFSTANHIGSAVIKGGSRSSATDAAVTYGTLNEDASNDSLPYTVFEGIAYDANGYASRGITVSSFSSAVARKAIFEDVTVTDSTKPITGTQAGVVVENAQDIYFGGLKVSGFPGPGFQQTATNGTSRNIRLVNPVIESNGTYGVLIPNASTTPAVIGFYIDGGEIKNNSRLSSSTYAGLRSGSGNYNIVSTARIFDNQTNPTQTVAVYSTNTSTIPYTTAPPTSGFWKIGDVARRYDLADGYPAGENCVASSQTTLTAQATAGATALTVGGTSYIVGDYIGILLSDNTYHWSTVASIVDGTHITITDAIPTGKTGSIGASVNTFRWKPLVISAITDSTSTNSSTTAASATAVKAAYDLANGKPSLTSTAPNADGIASAGTGVTAARVDHVHPTDTTRAAVDNPTFTTGVTAPVFTSNASDGNHMIQPYNSTAYSGTCSKGMVQTVGTPATLQVCTADGTWGAVTGAVASVNGNTGNITTSQLGAYYPSGTDVAIADGGTGASTAAAALANLGGIGGTTGSTDNAVILASGTGGATVKPSSTTSVDATGVVTIAKQSGVADAQLLYNDFGTQTTGSGRMGPTGSMAKSYFLRDPATIPSAKQVLVTGTPADDTVNGTTASVIPMTAMALDSGTFTPAATAGTNTSAVSGLLSHYMRVGNEVTVSGSITATYGGTADSIFVDFPIASNITATTDCAGAGAAGLTGRGVAVACDVSNKRAQLSWDASGTGGSGTITYTYTYTVK